MRAGVKNALDHPGFIGGDSDDGADAAGCYCGYSLVHHVIGNVAMFGVYAIETVLVVALMGLGGGCRIVLTISSLGSCGRAYERGLCLGASARRRKSDSRREGRVGGGWLTALSV